MYFLYSNFNACNVIHLEKVNKERIKERNVVNFKGYLTNNLENVGKYFV